MSVIEAASVGEKNRTRSQRSRIDRLVNLAEHLPDRERVLIEQVLGAGLSAEDVAQLSGRPPGRVRRELRRLVQRLEDPRFAFLLSRPHLLPPELPPVARPVIIEGRTMRDVSRALGISLYTVRQRMLKFDAMFHVHRRVGVGASC